MPTSIAPGLRSLFDKLADRFSRKAFADMRPLWADDAERPFYIAEEHPRPMTGWGELEEYWRTTDRTLKTLQAAYRLIDSVPIAEDLEFVSFHLRWQAEMSEQPMIAGEVRGGALCQRRGKDYRLRAYIEAPLAPIMYMRELYRTAARVDVDILAVPDAPDEPSGA